MANTDSNILIKGQDDAQEVVVKAITHDPCLLSEGSKIQRKKFSLQSHFIEGSSNGCPGVSLFSRGQYIKNGCFPQFSPYLQGPPLPIWGIQTDRHTQIHRQTCSTRGILSGCRGSDNLLFLSSVIPSTIWALSIYLYSSSPSNTCQAQLGDTLIGHWTPLE